MKGYVYLLHFTQPLKHARHYVGWTKCLDKRIAHHRKGSGARIIRALMQEGGDFVIARVWSDKCGNFERLIKNKRNHKKFCPICNKQEELDV